MTGDDGAGPEPGAGPDHGSGRRSPGTPGRGSAGNGRPPTKRFGARLADGWERALAQPALALVPLVTALLATDRIAAVLAHDGVHAGFQIGLPAAVVDLWQFVGTPGRGLSVNVGGPVDPPLALAVLPVVVVLRAALAAGYFGGIRSAVETGSPEFGANARRYFLPFLLYTAIPVALLLPAALLARSGDPGALLPLVVLLVPGVFLATYLFYATPYLVVLRETGLVAAARASLDLALDGGAYLRFALGFAGFVLVVSVAATAVVVNLGAVGLAVGAVAAAPLGLAANVATMRFVADVDPAAPALGFRDDGASGDRDGLASGGRVGRAGGDPDGRAGGDPDGAGGH